MVVEWVNFKRCLILSYIHDKIDVIIIQQNIFNGSSFMIKVILIKSLLFLVLFSGYRINAENIKIILPKVVPPYVLPKNRSGIHIDIIKHAFATQNIKVDFISVPNQRVKSFYKEYGDVSTHGKNDGSWKGYPTEVPMMVFFNKFIVKKSKIKELRTFDEAGKYRIIAFQNAKKYLGPKYKKMAISSPTYLEFGAHLPIEMLIMDRADIIVSEENIFKYHLLQLKTKNNKKIDSKNFNYINLLKKGNPYWWFFKSKELKEKFENGVRVLYKNGKMKSIFFSYKKKYNLSREAFIYMDYYYGSIKSVSRHSGFNKKLLPARSK